MLEEEILRTPEDPRNHHYLSVSLLGKKYYEPALREAEIALRLASNTPRRPFICGPGLLPLSVASTWAKWKRLSAFAWGIKLNPLHLDSYYLLSTIYYSKGLLQPFPEDFDKVSFSARQGEKKAEALYRPGAQHRQPRMAHSTSSRICIRNPWPDEERPGMNMRFHRGNALTKSSITVICRNFADPKRVC